MKTFLFALMLIAVSNSASAIQQTDSLTSILYDTTGRLIHSPEFMIDEESDLNSWASVENQIIAYLEGSIVYPEAYKAFGLMGMTITEFTLKGDEILSIKIHKSIGSGFDDSLEKSIQEIPKELIEGISNGTSEEITITLPVLFNIGTTKEKNAIVIQG
jgi:hypothetical protein